MSPSIQERECAAAEAHRLLENIESFETEIVALGKPLTQIADMFVMMRSVFEGSIALDVARHKKKRDDLANRWDGLLPQMGELSCGGDLSEGARRRFFDLDIEFHSALWEVSDQWFVVGIIRKLRDRLAVVAQPPGEPEMKITVLEHERIRNAVTAVPTKKSEIRESVSDHVRRAMPRWFPDVFQEADYPEKPNDFVFSDSSVRFSELLGCSPHEIPGYSEYEGRRFLALDLLGCRVVYGDSQYDKVDDFLAREHGDDYSLRYQIVELSK